MRSGIHDGKIYVVAGNKEQYENYIRKKAAELIASGTSVTLSHFVYVYDAQMLRGLYEVHGFFVGTYRERNDINDIVEQIRLVNRIPAGEYVIPPLLMPCVGDLRILGGVEEVYDGTKWQPQHHPY